MIWKDRYGHEWDLDSRAPCRRCGQDQPARFDSTCRGERLHAQSPGSAATSSNAAETDAAAAPAE